jgi:nitroreductase
MEFQEVVGTRRSMRFFAPYRQVEREKIQVILEAANRSSRSMNADYVKAVVVNRDDLSDELRESLRNPTTSLDLDLAPTYIMWFINLKYYENTKERLKEQIDHGILTASHGWSHAYVDEVIQKTVIDKISDDEARLNWMGAIEAGQAIANALLATYDVGLGTCLHNFSDTQVRKHMNIPDHWRRSWIQLIGYPLGDKADGGQRPRRPLPENFFEFKNGKVTPFEEDLTVREQLKAAGMIQEPSPLPYRKSEVRGIARMLGLPE